VQNNNQPFRKRLGENFHAEQKQLGTVFKYSQSSFYRELRKKF